MNAPSKEQGQKLRAAELTGEIVFPASKTRNISEVGGVTNLVDDAYEIA